ncbi:septum formation initiator family protein [Alkalibacterium psychrotolerans]
MGDKKQRIKHLNNSYAESKTLETFRAQKHKRKLKRRMQFIVAIGLLLVLLVGSSLIKSYIRLQELDEQRVVAEQELESLGLQQEELDYYISLLEDEEYVAKLARSEYYLTKDNEIVFSFPDDRKPDHLEAADEGDELDELIEEDD